MKMTKSYTIVTTSQYRKSYKRASKRGLDIQILDDIVKKLSLGEKLGPKYKDHILKGKYKGYHECHIAPDWLLIYSIKNDILVITLVDTGSHSDLFGK